jgi:hypothetical protein
MVVAHPRLHPKSASVLFESSPLEGADNAIQVLKNMDLNACPQTVCNALNKEGLVAPVKARKPLLWPCHFKACLNFCRRYKSWTAADWERVIFSDETKIN